MSRYSPQRIAALAACAILSAIVWPSGSQGEEYFTCGWGEKPACLDQNQKIVGKNATCFDQFTCAYDGFVCKKDYDESIDDYNKLVREYNDLVDVIEEVESCVYGARSLEAAKACL